MNSAMSGSDMTLPFWGLTIFILWTIAIVVFLLAVRIRHLVAGGSPTDFAIQDEKSLLWRLFRAQSNLVENLPLYLGVVFLLTVRGVSGAEIDSLVAVYILFRLVHSVIHIAGLNPVFRLLSLVIQLICLIALMVSAIFA